MRVALIGSRGQLGTDLVRSRPEGIELIALTSQDIDITDRDLVHRVLADLKPTAVINSAAYVRVDDAEDDAETAFRVNASGVKNIAEACDSLKALLVQMSTDYVFDGRKTQTPYTEKDIPNPINVYGVSKLAGEFFAANYCAKHYVVRSASLYGKAGARGKGGNFVYAILRKAIKGEPIRVVSDVVMSPTCTLDLALALWNLVRSGRPFGLYHIAAAGFCSWYAFAREILDLSNLRAELVPVSQAEYSSRAKRPPWSPISTVRDVHLPAWQQELRGFLREAESAP